MTLVPIIAVLMLSFAGYGWLEFQTIQIPRKLDEQSERPDPTSYPPKFVLHADGSFELLQKKVCSGGTVEDRRHLEARHFAATLRAIPVWREGPESPNVVQLQVDDGVLWGDFVATVSSVRHITAGEVLVVSDGD